MVVKVQKWGNSQGLRLAKSILERAHLAVGDEVEIIVNEERILIKKAAKPKFDLAEMVARMPQGYQVQEETWGEPVGKEEW